MRSLVTKINIFFTFFAGGILLYAQRYAPPRPPLGAPGPGAPVSQPIDMYVIWLMFLAVAMIFYFSKNKSRKIA